MAYRQIIPEEARAKARVRALAEGVRAHLLSESADTMRYSCPSATHPGVAYEVILCSPETGEDTCTCIAGTNKRPCKHVAAAWLMFEAQSDLRQVQEQDPKAAECPCCSDTLDPNDECACFCLPDPNLPSCIKLPECHYAAATRTLIRGVWYTKDAGGFGPLKIETLQDTPPLSVTLEAELAGLII